jgi:hypothetical protein
MLLPSDSNNPSSFLAGALNMYHLTNESYQKRAQMSGDDEPEEEGKSV